LSFLLWTTTSGFPIAYHLAAAMVAGLGFTSAGSCVRSRWAHRLKQGRLLDTAYALESSLDEVIFVVGPVLITTLATSISPQFGLATCAALGLTGALLLARRSDSEPPIARVAVHRTKAPLPLRLLVPLVLASASLGALFGGMELVIVAFATERGIVPIAGPLLTAWAAGSLVAGVVSGAISWKRTPVQRFRVGALLLAASIVPLPFVDSPPVLGLLLLTSGLTIAPTLIACSAAIQRAVSADRLNEALGWASMGTTAGVSGGAAALGILVDQSSSAAGLWGLVGFGGMLVAFTVAVREARPKSTP
jgi:hypothetical protein